MLAYAGVDCCSCASPVIKCYQREVIILNLSKNTIEILEYLDKKVSLDKSEALDIFGVGSDRRLNDLIDLGFIADIRNRTAKDDKAQYLGLYVLTDKGYNFFKDHNRAERDETNNLKSQRRHDYSVALFSGIIGGAAGLLVSIIFWIITGP